MDDGGVSPSKRRKRHASDDLGDNSSSNSSSDGYELEWVEKTKETLEGAGDEADTREEDGNKTCRGECRESPFDSSRLIKFCQCYLSLECCGIS